MRCLPAMLGLLAILPAAGVEAPGPSARSVRVGSKKFTESVILAEMAARLVRAAGLPAVHRGELGGTRILWDALLAGEIDLYPEYTGTLRGEILAGRSLRGEEELRSALEPLGVRMSRPLGFNNGYALGMKRERAEALGIRAISDLRRHPALRLGFSNEFMDRGDGWPGLRERYGLTHGEVRGLDHDLAYRGLETGALDVTDLYSTDAEIVHHGLAVLEDDLQYFPGYQAVLLFREDLARRAPGAAEAARRLEGLISTEEMRAMNARARLDRVSEARVAAEFLARALGLSAEVTEETILGRVLRHGYEHLAMVAVSLAAAVALSVPLGVLCARQPALARLIVGTAGVIQTIPSLALLVFMIPFLGIGERPAMTALFLYSLLPIIRNTYQGLRDIPPGMRESAEALGLSPLARLYRVELPLAAGAILSGIRTAAVINVGTATLGAFIGAGGYGQPILTGIRLNDISLVLQGAVPAALLALLVEAGFGLLERRLVPRGLRLRREGER